MNQKTLSNVSYTGAAVIIIIGIFFEKNLNPTVNSILTFLEALFLATILIIEIKKRKEKRRKI